MKFTLNKAVIRTGGNIGHTVNRDNLTDYEIRILKRIHGQDAVVNVVQTGEVEREKRDEYLRLARFYGVANVEKVFNVVLDEFSEWIDAKLDEELAAREAAKEKTSSTLTLKK
jgi:hypothetical protein